MRFTDEIAETHELSMGARGDHEEVIMTSKGEFATPYSMNIIDLCPVGALTSKDFRFESRRLVHGLHRVGLHRLRARAAT